MRIQRNRIISCKYGVLTIKMLTCFCPVSFKDTITEKKRQREKRLAEEKTAETATSSENADTATNNMEEDSTDSRS